MFQLPFVDPRIPRELVPQASRRRGATFARSLIRAGVVDAGLLPANPGRDHIKTCQGVLEGWARRELGSLKMLRPRFSMHLQDADAQGMRAVRPCCRIEWGGESFGVRCVGPALDYLEGHRPRLGKSVLEVLESRAWGTLPIYTPCVVLECASDTYWYGESDEEMALEECCGENKAERETMREQMVTRAMFTSTFPAWALGGRARPLGRRALQQVATASKDRRIAGVIEDVLALIDIKVSGYNWSERDGRFVGFSGVLAWAPDDQLTTRVLDDYEQMVGESGDYFESCGEESVGAEDHEALARWFEHMGAWCEAVSALDRLIWRLTEGDWPGLKKSRP